MDILTIAILTIVAVGLLILVDNTLKGHNKGRHGICTKCHDTIYIHPQTIEHNPKFLCPKCKYRNGDS